MNLKETNSAVYAVGIWIALMVLVLGLGLFFSNKGIISTTSFSRMSNAFLVTLTGLYVIFTGLVLRESVRQRMQDAQPTFALKIEGYGVEVTNVGNGPALDTSITLKLMDDENGEEAVTVKNQDVPSGESVAFGRGKFESYGWRVFDDEQFGETLVLEGEYTDRYQNRHDIPRREFDVEDYRKRMSQEMFASESNDLDGVERQLEGIRTAMDQAIRMAELDFASVARTLRDQGDDEDKERNNP